ncbi:MAG: hypothetical protein ACSHYB_15495 [Roseibacillus sp.]
MKKSPVPHFLKLLAALLILQTEASAIIPMDSAKITLNGQPLTTGVDVDLELISTKGILYGVVDLIEINGQVDPVAIYFAPHGANFVSGDAYDGVYRLRSEATVLGQYFAILRYVTLDGEEITVGQPNTTRQFSTGSIAQATLSSFGPFGVLGTRVDVDGGGMDVSSQSQTLRVEVHYSYILPLNGTGQIPECTIRLRPPSDIEAPIVIGQNIGIGGPFGTGPNHQPGGQLSPSSSAARGSFVFSIPFDTSASTGVWEVDFAMTRVEAGLGSQTTTTLDAHSFHVYSDAIGGTQLSPILPGSIDTSGLFEFFQQEGGFWYDPPVAFGYLYTLTNSARATEILQLPIGIDSDGKFRITTPTAEEIVPVSSGYSLLQSDGLGVSSFAITDIDGIGDGSQGQAFPVRLGFDSTADFTMRALHLPEPQIELLDHTTERTIKLTWDGQEELSYQLEKSDNLLDWQPVGEPIAGVNGEQTLLHQDNASSNSYRLKVTVILPSN